MLENHPNEQPDGDFDLSDFLNKNVRPADSDSKTVLGADGHPIVDAEIVPTGEVPTVEGAASDVEFAPAEAEVTYTQEELNKAVQEAADLGRQGILHALNAPNKFKQQHPSPANNAPTERLAAVPPTPPTESYPAADPTVHIPPAERYDTAPRRWPKVLGVTAVALAAGGIVAAAPHLIGQAGERPAPISTGTPTPRGNRLVPPPTLPEGIDIEETNPTETASPEPAPSASEAPSPTATEDITVPKQPKEPSKPEKPTIKPPKKPSKPDKPSKPEKPSKPDKPSKPSKPNKPEKPSKPDKPDKPSKPEKSEKSDKPGKKLVTPPNPKPTQPIEQPVPNPPNDETAPDDDAADNESADQPDPAPTNEYLNGPELIPPIVEMPAPEPGSDSDDEAPLPEADTSDESDVDDAEEPADTPAEEASSDDECDDESDDDEGFWDRLNPFNDGGDKAPCHTESSDASSSDDPTPNSTYVIPAPATPASEAPAAGDDEADKPEQAADDEQTPEPTPEKKSWWPW